MRVSPWGVEKSRKLCLEIHRFQNEQHRSEGAGGMYGGHRERGRKRDREKASGEKMKGRKQTGENRRIT